MTQDAEELLKKVLALSPEDRAELAFYLIDSLDPMAESALEAWNDEIARRIEELDSGKVQTIPWEEVRRQVTARTSQWLASKQAVTTR